MKIHLSSAENLRRWPLFLLGVCFLGFIFTSGAAAAKPTFNLQSVKGRVEIQPSGKGAWKAVGRGSHEASVGDHIRTGSNSSVYIVTEDGARIALGEKTEIVLKEPDKPRGWRVLLGRVIAFVTGDRGLEARTPSAVAAVEGTTFQLDVSEDGATVLTVVEGAVNFSNELGSVSVLSSQQSTARVGQAPTRPIVVDPSSLTAWEANLQTLIISFDHTLVSANTRLLEQELARRQAAVSAQLGDAAAHAALAEVLSDLHRTDEALFEAQRAVELAPEQPRFLGVQGFVMLQAGRPAEAEEAFAKAARAEPENAQWQIGLGLVVLGQREAAPAIEFLRQAVALAPQDATPRAYLTAAFLREGNLEQAYSTASEAIGLDPENAIANSYLSYVLLAKGNIEDAVVAADKAARNESQSALAQEALGNALFFAGKAPEARQALDRAIALNPLSAGAHLTLAKLMASEGDMEDALHEAQLSVALNQQSAPARSTLGLLFLLNNDPVRAGKQFQQALALDPSLADAHTGWGQVLVKRGRFRDALEQQKLALSLDTDSAAAENNLGGLYASEGRMKEARQHLQRAIELQPEWGMPQANLAQLYLEENRLREALEAGERAVALGEHSAFAHTVLARIYALQGRTDRARFELRLAVALDDRYPQAHYQLARLYLAEGRSRDAVREILYAVTLDPSAMLETRRYARTEAAAAVGSFGEVALEGRHSDQALGGRLSYFLSGRHETRDGFRSVNQDLSEQFGELIAGYQAEPTRQFVLFSTRLDRDAGLPGPETATSLGDTDDRGKFFGDDAVLAYRQRFSPEITSTFKYTIRWSRFRFLNPDSMTGEDATPFRNLTVEDSAYSPEIRVDANFGKRTTMSLGYAYSRDKIKNDGIASLFDHVTGDIFPSAFAVESKPVTDTAWLDVGTDFSDRFRLTLGGYWGRESGSSRVLSPKIVALYLPNKSTWWAFVVSPLFRSDAAELAPVEALADPKGLRYLNFAGEGFARSYELRYQQVGSKSNTTTAALTYQQVNDLLIDLKDPALTGIQSRALLDRGHRWVADAAYEQWLTNTITGRVWARWQPSRGRFPSLQLDDVEWPYNPRWMIGGQLDYIHANGVRAGLEAIAVDERFANPENSARLGSYYLLNLRVQYQQDLHRRYFVTVTNLTGRDYQNFAGFPQAGRAIVVGLDYRF